MGWELGPRFVRVPGEASRSRRIAGYALCWLALLSLIAALVAAQDVSAAARPNVSIVDAVVRLPAAPGLPAAGYATIRAIEPLTLTGVSSPDARRIELHRTVASAGGVMRMDRLNALPVHGETKLAPHGLHLMIFGLKAAKAGGTVHLVFHFLGAPDVAVTARALPPAGAIGDPRPMPGMA